MSRDETQGNPAVRCVVCKTETFGSEPLEHILPEGLGNTDFVLRRGLVCGKCNDYFASKVEKPFLELWEIVALRFEQALPSKKGRVPPLSGVLTDAVLPIEAVRDPATGEMSICLSEEAVRAVVKMDRGQIILPISRLVKPSRVVSRFVGKVALEALAHRVEHNDEFLAELTDNAQLDALRRHVRYGDSIDWPVSVRQIYSADDSWTDGKSTAYQIVHEFDFLRPDNDELYFVLALFGQEFAINLGGPGLDGWNDWLRKNPDMSPLHHGKNGGREVRL